VRPTRDFIELHGHGDALCGAGAAAMIALGSGRAKFVTYAENVQSFRLADYFRRTVVVVGTDGEEVVVQPRSEPRLGC
jgi:hypothetical protein